MGTSDRHGIRKECLGQTIGKPGRLNDPPAADSLGRDPGLNRTIEGEIIPRLMMLFDRQMSGAFLPTVKRSSSFLPEDVHGFVNLVLENDVDIVCDYVQKLRESGESLPAIYLSLLAPAARDLGDRWMRDECTFTAVTLGVSRMHQVLLRFSSCFSPNRVEHGDTGRSALIVPVPGEQHTFGLLMLTDFFRREGWNVLAGCPESTQELSMLLESQRFDVVGCSVSSERYLDALPGIIGAIRKRSKNKKIKVIVGGQLFSDQPGLASSVGADATASDGVDAVRQAERLVERAR